MVWMLTCLAPDRVITISGNCQFLVLLALRNAAWRGYLGASRDFWDFFSRMCVGWVTNSDPL